VSDDEYEFHCNTYKSGLIVKQLAPACLVDAATPENIAPFVTAASRQDLPSFTQTLHHYAQDMLKVDQHVRVVCEEQHGLIGHVIDISFGWETVIPEGNHKSSSILVPLRNLVPVYRVGDSVKAHLSASCGLILLVDETNNRLTYVEDSTHREVSLLYNMVRYFFTPSRS